MRRLLIVLLFVTLLAAMTPAIAHAGPLAQGGGEGEGDAIGNVIGTLGLYAAMMAVLAVGSEVLIDAVRPIFGLKRKTSATEARHAGGAGRQPPGAATTQRANRDT